MYVVYVKMTYVITNHTKARAKQLNVKVKPSSKRHKKLDVIKNDKIVASIGDTRYPDYGTYLDMESNNQIEKGTANKRRQMYKARHGKYPKNSPGYFADQLLW